MFARFLPIPNYDEGSFIWAHDSGGFSLHTVGSVALGQRGRKHITISWDRIKLLALWLGSTRGRGAKCRSDSFFKGIFLSLGSPFQYSSISPYHKLPNKLGTECSTDGLMRTFKRQTIENIMLNAHILYIKCYR